MNAPLLTLDEAARQELLKLVRHTLQSYFETGKEPEYHPQHEALLQQSGAFVSLYNGENLRGCIGFLYADGKLFRTVQRCALSAALEDTRFSPVTLDEVAHLTVEISVLSPMQRIEDVETIEVGRHGLMISLGGRRGLLLPQVATKYNWDRDTFLAQTCRKAGLPAHAWHEPNVVIQVFEALVFSS
jgi:AmmeMemoRadiSam system protein A